jgi:hypothetical protein
VKFKGVLDTVCKFHVKEVAIGKEIHRGKGGTGVDHMHVESSMICSYLLVTSNTLARSQELFFKRAFSHPISIHCLAISLGSLSYTLTPKKLLKYKSAVLQLA